MNPIIQPTSLIIINMALAIMPCEIQDRYMTLPAARRRETAVICGISVGSWVT